MNKNDKIELELLRTLERSRNRFHEAKARILYSVGAGTQFAKITDEASQEYELARIAVLEAEHELLRFNISSR